VTLESHLYEDLDLDSIDAVDLVIKLKEITGKMANPEEFKSVRTVGDVVSVISHLIQK
jgi:acyl carrier protein